MSEAEISVEVIYALPGRHVLRRVRLPAGSCIADAVRASGLAAEFPEIDPDRVGIYGKRAGPQDGLRNLDRVELYRPLRADPKELRRSRATARRR
jgi:putative ubiquitin-RnfH superfamily antitoxin RatB of RatAB toxin-antitoxin module